MPWGCEQTLATGIGDFLHEPLDLQRQSKGLGAGTLQGLPGGKEAEVRPPWLWAATLVPLVPTPGAQEQLSRATPWAGLSTATLSTGLIWPDPRPYKRHPPGVGWAASLRKSWVGGEEMGLRGFPEGLGVLYTDFLTPRPPGPQPSLRRRIRQTLLVSPECNQALQSLGSNCNTLSLVQVTGYLLQQRREEASPWY